MTPCQCTRLGRLSLTAILPSNSVCECHPHHALTCCSPVAAYRTLLAELVREPNAKYRDWKDKLAKDSQVS